MDLKGSPSKVDGTLRFFERLGINEPMPEIAYQNGFNTDLIRSCLQVQSVELGHIVCSFKLKPQVTNAYNTFHGGGVASTATTVASACMQTLIADKPFFLGELAVTYLSAANIKMELEIEARVLRMGRSVGMVSVEFKDKGTKKLVYAARATFYNTPVSNL
ncbi:acyl-coenzyme A thioesterase 13 [Amborella trichopoda]|uniref:Thioesterase domain-containing protein n=1 Tax=Amborella trichopoda TaxID=13333 RepID=U5DFW9_AMBTC|nr:acyl-coenzyme A thioesterase 13 [Amborella trichopoda]ERN19323.1 hypothetical protein AMTR_s00069p00075860 [Amborella trichopoda]|eukprot:XP_006857856.1 acyl-coenzyme A thioesterase 13 [Amborella trichopoda]